MPPCRQSPLPVPSKLFVFLFSLQEAPARAAAPGAAGLGPSRHRAGAGLQLPAARCARGSGAAGQPCPGRGLRAGVPPPAGSLGSGRSPPRPAGTGPAGARAAAGGDAPGREETGPVSPGRRGRTREPRAAPIRRPLPRWRLPAEASPRVRGAAQRARKGRASGAVSARPRGRAGCFPRAGPRPYLSHAPEPRGALGDRGTAREGRSILRRVGPRPPRCPHPAGGELGAERARLREARKGRGRRRGSLRAAGPAPPAEAALGAQAARSRGRPVEPVSMGPGAASPALRRPGAAGEEGERPGAAALRAPVATAEENVSRNGDAAQPQKERISRCWKLGFLCS